METTTQSMPQERLFSLREVADDFHAGSCRLSTDLTFRIGDETTAWELVLDTEWEHASYDQFGRLCCSMWLHRADVTLGVPQEEPDLLEGRAQRDVDTISQVFGVDLDAHVWKKSSVYTKE